MLLFNPAQSQTYSTPFPFKLQLHYKNEGFNICDNDYSQISINIIKRQNMNCHPSTVKIQDCSSQIQPMQEPAIFQEQQKLGNSHVYAKTGHWNENEKLHYLMFIEYHYSKLKVRQNRRFWKIFKAMSNFIKTRKPNQCRSHHKKMQTYFQSIPAIISFYKQHIPNYQDQYQKHIIELQDISFGVEVKSLDQSHIEEKLQNNDSHANQQQQIPTRKDHAKRTSIKLNDYEDEDISKEPQLPKTDDTIRTFLQIQRQNHGHPNSRQTLTSNLKGVQHNPYQYPYFSLSCNTTIPSPPFLQTVISPLQLQNPQNVNFFQFYMNRATSQDQYREWIQCQHLYLVWRSKMESLIKNQQ